MGKGKLFRVNWRWTKRRKNLVTDGSKGALEILPLEIWTKILEMVTDFPDRMNCFNTCQPWKDILGADLFTRDFNQILPQIMDHLDFSSVLACRQVCSSWCTAVDNIVANNPKFIPFTVNRQKTSNAVNPRYIPDEFQTSPTWALTSVAHVNHLLDEMKTYFALGSHRCPIPGRCLRMTYLTATAEEVLDEGTIVEHRDLSCLMTKSMGHHISFFSFEFDPLQIIPLQLCQLLHRHLHNLPNLRQLAFEVRSLLADPWTMDEYLAHFDYLKENPLPYIATLESLCFQSIDIPIQIHHQLLSTHGPQLKKLEVRLSRLSSNLLALLTNLSELTVHVETRADIRTLTLCSSPLQKLSIMGFYTVFLAEYLLEVIQSFPILYQLDLELYQKVQLWDDDCTFGNQWENTSLKRVNISINAETGQKVFPFSFNFLKCFSSLEHLSMHYNELSLSGNVNYANDMMRPLSDQNQNKEIIQFKKFLRCGRMYHSNIWQLLPKLKTFIYTDPLEHYYNRLTYNQLNPLPQEVAIVKKTEETLKKKDKKLGRRVVKSLGDICIGAIGEFLI